MTRLSSLGLTLPVAALAAALGFAQIERLDLAQMVAKTDNAVHGKILDKQVIRIDHPVDGPELDFTHLTIEGTSLVDGKALTATVTFPGGFVAPGQGVYNSEAPTADETRIGSEVVAFYKWTDNMGGDLAANALYASHGGIYRVAQTRGGAVALGKGDGYALSGNVNVVDLQAQIAKLK
jgi:hypothetical protein